MAFPVAPRGAYQPVVPVAPRGVYQPIVEDSAVRKVLSAIPFVGIAVYLIALRSLDEKLSEQLESPPSRPAAPFPELNPAEPDPVIRLIALKNQYYVIGMVQETLTAALLIAHVAAGIFTGLAALAALTIAGGFLASTLMACSYISHNTNLIQEIKQMGIQPNMSAL